MPPPPHSRLLALLTAGQPPPPLRLLLQVHAHVLVSGLLSSPFPNPFGHRLVAAFAFSDPASPCSPGPLLHALALLASIPSPPDSAAPYNAVLRALSLCPDRGRLLDRCLPLYRSLLRSGSARPDHLTFPFLLKACSRMRDPSCGAVVLGHVRRLGFGADVFVLNAAMHFLAASRSVVQARRLFDESPVRDVISWNTLIGGYIRRGLAREALEVFRRMAEDGSVRPDEVTMIGAVSGCAQLQDLELGKRLHGYVESNVVRCTVKLMNAVMDMYVKCGRLELAKSVFERIEEKTIVSWTTMLVGHTRLGMMEDARKLFNKMPERDVFPWNALMAGYVQHKQGKEALALFHEMQDAKVDPNEITMVNLLSACSQLGALEMGMWVHHYIDRHHLSLSVALGTSLVDMYAKCGNIRKAVCVFNEIPEKNALTWTAMICGLANHGHADEAIEHFQRMIELGLLPDEITFIGVLSACCHAGLVEEGQKFFSLMTSKYHLERKMKHYSCMIDLLGRAGHLDEAEELVNSMPMDPDAVVWGALFFACRMHGNITLGEKAAMKLVELDPSDSGIYVLLATMYAEANMRTKADKVRVMMRHLGVEKVPGCSCIELNGVVHEFIVKDKSHADTSAIYDCLHEITLQMRCTASTFDICAAGVM